MRSPHSKANLHSVVSAIVKAVVAGDAKFPSSMFRVECNRKMAPMRSESFRANGLVKNGVGLVYTASVEANLACA